MKSIQIRIAGCTDEETAFIHALTLEERRDILVRAGQEEMRRIVARVASEGIELGRSYAQEYEPSGLIDGGWAG